MIITVILFIISGFTWTMYFISKKEQEKQEKMVSKMLEKGKLYSNFAGFINPKDFEL